MTFKGHFQPKLFCGSMKLHHADPSQGFLAAQENLKYVILKRAHEKVKGKRQKLVLGKRRLTALVDNRK